MRLLPEPSDIPACPIIKNNEVSFERLADIMLELQAKGCHNINLVSPTHFSAQIIKAIAIAALNGLKIPLVYNTNAYDSLQALRLLDGIIDIYLPDIKYSDDNEAREYSKAKGLCKEFKTSNNGDEETGWKSCC